MLKKVFCGITFIIVLSGCSSNSNTTYTFDLTKYEEAKYASNCPIVSTKVNTSVSSELQNYWVASLKCIGNKFPPLNYNEKFRVTAQAPKESQPVGYVFLKNNSASTGSQKQITYLSSSAFGLGGNYGVPITNHALAEDGVSLYLIFRSISKS